MNINVQDDLEKMENHIWPRKRNCKKITLTEIYKLLTDNTNKAKQLNFFVQNTALLLKISWSTTDISILDAFQKKKKKKLDVWVCSSILQIKEYLDKTNQVFSFAFF